MVGVVGAMAEIWRGGRAWEWRGVEAGQRVGELGKNGAVASEALRRLPSYSADVRTLYCFMHCRIASHNARVRSSVRRTLSWCWREATHGHCRWWRHSIFSKYYANIVAT